jgi:hypothetical protein
MLKVKKRVGIMPEVETDNYPDMPHGGVVRIGIGFDLSGALPASVQPLPAYHPREIVYDGKRYILREPLECAVTWEDDAYFIRYRPFDLVATDYTLPGAILEFSSKFGFYYEHSNELALSGVRRLGTRLESIRLQMNALVLEVCATEGTNMYQPLNQELL